ncbi:MAG: hypothetical protein SGPRY_011743, partial [Prymnesium sp.]
MEHAFVRDAPRIPRKELPARPPSKSQPKSPPKSPPRQTNTVKRAVLSDDDVSDPDEVDNVDEDAGGDSDALISESDEEDEKEIESKSQPPEPSARGIKPAQPPPVQRKPQPHVARSGVKQRPTVPAARPQPKPVIYPSASKFGVDVMKRGRGRPKGSKSRPKEERELVKAEREEKRAAKERPVPPVSSASTSALPHRLRTDGGESEPPKRYAGYTPHKKLSTSDTTSNAAAPVTQTASDAIFEPIALGRTKEKGGMLNKASLTARKTPHTSGATSQAAEARRARMQSMNRSRTQEMDEGSIQTREQPRDRMRGARDRAACRQGQEEESEQEEEGETDQASIAACRRMGSVASATGGDVRGVKRMGEAVDKSATYRIRRKVEGENTAAPSTHQENARGSDHSDKRNIHKYASNGASVSGGKSPDARERCSQISTTAGTAPARYGDGRMSVDERRGPGEWARFSQPTRPSAGGDHGSMMHPVPMGEHVLSFAPGGGTFAVGNASCGSGRCGAPGCGCGPCGSCGGSGSACGNVGCGNSGCGSSGCGASQ